MREPCPLSTQKQTFASVNNGLFAAQAQDLGDVPMGEVGDPQAGFEYAHSTCAGCHAVGEEQSPNRNAPRFKDVAKTPGMTPTALMVWLQRANHPTMPNGDKNYEI
jgi:mono/diheme cytochrome c family protein